MVGDVHGCFAELQRLLAELEVAPADRLISVGDFVDRGPDSRAVWRFLQDRPNTVVVCGNHERKHVRGVLSYSQQIVRLQLGDEYADFRAWAAELPYWFETDELVVVHGGFEAGVPLAEQREDVLSSTMGGAKYLDRKYGGDWTERYDGEKTVVFGHRVVGDAPVWFTDRTVGIDTGACHGGTLSALVVPGFTAHSVPAARDYWREERVRWQVPVLRSLDWEAMRWLKIERELGRVRTDRDATVRAFAKERAAWLGELEALVPAVIAGARARSAGLFAAAVDEKDFKRQVARERFAALLFAAHAGSLDRDALRAQCTTPAALRDAAQALA